MLAYYGDNVIVNVLGFVDRTIAYLKKIFDRKLKADGSIDPDTFHTNANQLIKGIEEGFNTTMTNASFRDGRMQLMQRMRRNTFTFIAFKSHSNIAQVVNELKDPNGKLRSWPKFKKAALKIDKDYNVNWLKTEYNTAKASAQMADKWLKIEKRKDILPWLEYKTQEDDRVRRSHELLNGTIKKVDDPFWDTYYPPNGWGCRCYVLQHAEATEKDPEGYPDTKQMPPAFRTNPGKTGKVWNERHPYFIEAKESVKKKIENSMIRIVSDDFRIKAKEALVGKSFTNKNVTFKMTNKAVKSILRKPHKDRLIRMDLLDSLEHYFPIAKFIKSVPEEKGRAQIKQWLYYEVIIDGISSFINIAEMASGQYKLHAITDSIK